MNARSPSRNDGEAILQSFHIMAAILYLKCSIQNDIMELTQVSQFMFTWGT